MSDERWFERLAAAATHDRPHAPKAPARLKSRIYSALVREMSAAGGLCSLTASKADGRRLCIFEEFVAAMPIGEERKAANLCRVCHARVLGERLEHAPIFWPGCPYSTFHNEPGGNGG